MSGIEIVDAGIATTIQDRGRPGFGHLGVPPSGAVDPDLAALTNRLVGNPPDAAVIETCGNFVMRLTGAAMVATSSELAPTSMQAGEMVRVRVDADHLWQYVAVRGGIDVPMVLGSRSTDTLSGLGPAPVAAGQLLTIGAEPHTLVAVDHAPRTDVARPARLGPGPRHDWFETASIERILAG